MKQSTFSAVMANNLLTVLQGYSKSIRLLLVMFLTLTVSTNAWAQTWEKATSIAAGDVVLLVCESKKMELSSISTTSTKYGIGVAYTTTPAGAYQLTVEAGSSSGTYSLKNGSNYLYWTSGNSLATNATKSANTSWSITFSNGNATIKNAKDNSRVIGWNASSPRFACYTSSQTAVQLYKKVTAVQTVAVTGVSLNQTSLTLTAGNSETLTATVSPNNATDKTITWSTSNPSVATVSNGKVTAVAEGSAIITVTTNDGKKTATCNVKVNPKPKYTVTLNAGPGTCAASVTESSAGAGVTLPTPTLNGCDEWSFAGWKTTSAVTTETTTKPTLIAAGTYKPASNITLYAVYQRTETTEGVETTTITTDKLTRAITGVTDGSTTYSTWSDKTVTSPAVYAGNSAGSNNSIQLRSNNSNSGVITTASGGKAKKVTVEWQSSTSSGRTLDIYGKNSAYSAATELYSTSTQGTKLGSIVKGTSTTLTITGDYEYIGLRSNSGAMYLTSISIDWATTTAGGTTITTYYHSTPDCATQTAVSLRPQTSVLGKVKFTHFLR